MNKYIVITVVLLIVIFILYRKNRNNVTYNLPDNKDPNVFGPYYWTALHDITNRIPCPLCKPFGQKFMIFFHDVVNKKLDKPLFDPENYNEMLNYLKNS